MLLSEVAHYNKLSDKLRKELEDKVTGFGKRVRYKFNISHPNPDPSKYNGDTVYPTQYTLDPAVFNITDPYQSKIAVKVGLVEENGVDEKGIPNRFKKIKIAGREKGILELNLADNMDDFHIAMYLELHPKLKGGKFADKNKHQVFERIDEKAYATEQSNKRTAKLKALNAAQSMSEKELRSFADAMLWDSTDELEVLKNKVEDLAENDPVYFNDLVSGQSIKYQSAVKQALDRGLIEYEAGEMKFMWASTQQPITVLSPVGDKNHVEKLAEWLLLGGDKAQEVYKKITELLK